MSITAPTSMSKPALSPSAPQNGFLGLLENWRSDLTAGFLVFLIALPLCLGIAMASGFPPMSGIISAFIGGVVVSRISGSYVTINGPAAGLIVVILSAVQSLGAGDAMAGYRYTLAAIFMASLLQILMGLLKAGRLNAYFPASVVHGMLAAIGIIIMAKQIHVMLGVKPESSEILPTIAEIPHSLANLNPEISLIGFSGLAILVLWGLVQNPTLKRIPDRFWSSPSAWHWSVTLISIMNTSTCSCPTRLFCPTTSSPSVPSSSSAFPTMCYQASIFPISAKSVPRLSGVRSLPSA
jgi:MFS superfamily sulfate permease-like transporter